jgi:DNA-binding HxlR family transcriptional regulator
MTKIKETSTIQENKKLAFQNCPITFVMESIGGYWKPIILFNLLTGKKRYGELKKAMPHITEKVLIQNLKQLEVADLIIRMAKPVVPPFVEYSLTKSGKALRPILYEMAVWAANSKNKNSNNYRKNLTDFPS